MDIISRTKDTSQIFHKICKWWVKAHTEHREMSSIILKKKKVFERLQRLFKRLRVEGNPDNDVLDQYISETREAINRGYIL